MCPSPGAWKGAWRLKLLAVAGLLTEPPVAATASPDYGCRLRGYLAPEVAKRLAPEGIESTKTVINLANWQAVFLGIFLTVVAVLLTIWWRQRSYRWAIVLVVCLAAAPLLSWWSGQVFQVADYRAGCDGLCPGFRGAPVRIFQGQAAGSQFLPGMFLVNSLAYLILLLAWSMVMRAWLLRDDTNASQAIWRPVLWGLLLLIGPFALAPLYLPPPEAHVRGDPQRVAINARREVYMYDQLASAPVLRVGLEDVRPRRDGQPGMRVCLRTYTFFYLPAGYMYLDMTPEGVHSNAGGVFPRTDSCWE